MNDFELDFKQGVIERVVDDIRMDSQMGVLRILSQTLTKNKKVDLSFGGNQPFANIETKTIKLPRQVYPHPFVDWLLKKAITLHESYHIMFTGNAKERMRDFGMEKEKAGKQFRPSLMKYIMNAIEDVRIEYLGMNEYKGSTELVGFVNAFYHRIAKLEKERMQQDLLYSLCFELKGYRTTYHDRKLLNRLIMVGKDVTKQDFEGMFDTAIKIYNIIESTLPDSELNDLGQQSYKHKQSIRGFDSELGDTQRFDSNGKKSKTKLTKKEEKEINEALEDIKEDFEEMFDDDEVEDVPEDEKESLDVEEEKEDEEADKNEGSGEPDDNDSEEKDDSESGSGKDSEDSESDEDDERDEPIFEDVFDEETINKIAERFNEEQEARDKIEKQVEEKGEDKAKGMGKEFDDSYDSGLRLEIPTKGNRLPFNVSEADSLARMIGDELKNKIIVGKETMTQQTSGRLHLKSAVRSLTNYKASGEFDNHIFQRDETNTPEHSVLLSLDCSGSMQTPIPKLGKNRMDCAKEVLFVLAKVFEHLDVKFAIRGFSSYLDYHVKSWDEEFDWKVLAGLYIGDTTPTAQATDIALKRMMDIEDELKIVFTITDGEPDSPDYTKEIVENCKKNGILVFGVFYGDSENEPLRKLLKFVYGEGNYIMVDNPEALMDGIIKLYEKILAQKTFEN